MLRDVFKIHPFAVEDVKEFHQRPNFAWLVSRIGSAAAFWGIGVGTELMAVAALLIMFRRRGWMGKGS
ncbi:MAG: hypothetical protein ACTHNU_05675 [Gaiellales bacterium]